MIRVYRKVSSAEYAKISDKASTWLTSGNPANMFNSCQREAKTAVMEYLANEIDATFYPSAVDTPIVE